MKSRYDKPIGQVLVTKDLDKFVLLPENRQDMNSREKRIAKSVSKVGYINAPIIVNENYEVIDGKARLTYCKETGQPKASYTIDSERGANPKDIKQKRR